MGMSATKVERVISLPLISQVDADLTQACKRSELSATDIVYRAISLYEFLDSERAAGTQMLLRRHDGATFVVDLI